ncbi:hypothetical protein HKD37_14G041134 [Glycine soja]
MVENIRHDLISWVAPNQEDIALNYEDAVVHTGNVAAYGEVARGYTCEFIYGFGAKLKGCSILEAQLWGILIGMKMVWARGFHRITPHREIHEVYRDGGFIKWCHILREVNKVVDILAKEALYAKRDLQENNVVPNCIVMHLELI